MIANKIKNSFLKITFIFFLTILCVSPFSYSLAQDKKQNTTQSADDNSVYTEDKLNIFVDKKNSQFVIKLKSNPTTGYSWFLREYDASLITPLKHTFLKPEEKQTLMGAPGYELWTFRLKPAAFTIPQETIIRLVYAQPWHSDGSTQMLFHVFTH